MFKRLCAIAAVLLAVTVAAPPASAVFRFEVGILDCRVDGGPGFILGSQKFMGCVFRPASSLRPAEPYAGSITKIGLDVGLTTGARIIWAVLAPTTTLPPGALDGRYFGVSAEATPGVGVGGNVLIGGFRRSIVLNPVSVQGQTGANVSATLSGLVLRDQSTVVFKR